MADYLRLFASDYASARVRFCEGALAAGFELSSYPIDQRGPDGGELTIDVALRGAATSARALAISSGLHGIEGYFGSAVQRAWLEQCAPASEGDCRIVLIHALNPFGFAWRRRVNEDNVDLNRNFMLPGEPFEGAHDAYRELSSLLNPESPPTRFDPFLIAALPPLARHGFTALKNAVAQGQYEYPRGLFFGGHAASATQRILARHLGEWIGRAERVLHIDLHSGRGKFATYKACVDMAAASPRFARLQRAFGEDAVEGFEPGGVLYEVRGGLGRWLESRFEAAQYDCVLAEFGTYNAIKVLAALRAENRAHHYGRADVARLEHSKRQLFEAFCPRSPRWRRTVVERALSLLRKGLAELTQS